MFAGIAARKVTYCFYPGCAGLWLSGQGFASSELPPHRQASGAHAQVTADPFMRSALPVAGWPRNRRGEEHEQAVLEGFRADGWEVADLSGAGDPAGATALLDGVVRGNGL